MLHVMRNTTHDKATTTPDRIGVNEREGAELIGVSPRTFRKLITQGVIRPIKIPGVRRNIFAVEELRGVVQRWKQPGDPEAA
jgi:hypothetical protein